MYVCPVVSKPKIVASHGRHCHIATLLSNTNATNLFPRVRVHQQTLRMFQMISDRAPSRYIVAGETSAASASFQAG
jgi:hypothetical protein